MQMIGQDRLVYGRDAYEPAFTPSFDELGLNAPVRDGETRLGFTVRDVLPERRWAIRESGELLDANTFKTRYIEWASKVVRNNRNGGGRIIAIAATNGGAFDPNLMPIPTARDFVSVAHDYQGREIRIGFNPNAAPSTERFKLVDAGGKEVDPLAPGARKLERIAMLTELNAKGTLSDEQLAAELREATVTAHRVEAPAADDDGDAEDVVGLAPPPQRRRGKAGVDGRRTPTVTACGRAAKGKAGKQAHERVCVRCRAIAAEASATQPEEGAA